MTTNFFSVPWKGWLETTTFISARSTSTGSPCPLFHRLEGLELSKQAGARSFQIKDTI
jgi:hypothetical protein